MASVAPAAIAQTTGTRDAPGNRIEIVRHDADRRVDVLVDGKPFTAYIYPTTIKKPVLFPLRAANGIVVTRAFPPGPGERTDHPHHVGLWFTYEDVNGLDFWNNSDAIPAARAPKMGTIVHRAVKATHDGVGEATLDVASDWVDFHGKALLREDTRYVFHAATGLRGIDRITTLTALDDTVHFNDAKDGALGMRVVRALEQPSNEPGEFRDASGAVTKVPVMNNEGVTGRYRSSEGLEGDSVWATRGRWTYLSGTVQREPVTIAILDHPSNVGFPTYWHARGYGLFAANPFGQKVFSKGNEQLNFRLAPRQSATLRYRILILNGKPSDQEMEKYYAEWAR